ncbi:MAG: class I SAM-dependent methyltransferase [Rhodospirillaceae bacterium]
MFKDLSQESHVDLTETTYTVQSWGTDRQRSIDAHGPRIKKTIQWFQSQAPLNVTDKYLDVGAGVGVLIHYLAQDYSINQNSISAVEPVEAIAKLLQDTYHDIDVHNTDIEQLDTEILGRQIDSVFCFGVDYLFKDLTRAFRIIKSLIRDGGRLMISRNVFLNMPCFFGGVPIRSFDQLVKPNPLISVYMFPDQYLEFVGRWFKVTGNVVAEERYPQGATYDPGSGKRVPIAEQVNGKTVLLDCSVDHSHKQLSKPILKPEQGRGVLGNLGAQILS